VNLVRERKNNFTRRSAENRRVYEEYRAPGKRRGPRKKRPVNYPLIFIILAVFILVVAYMVQGLYAYANRQVIPTTSVQYGSVDAPVIYSGVLLRDERVYTSPATGTALFYYNDRERLKPSAVVCAIQESEAAAQLAQDIQDLDLRILSMQDRRQEISIFSEDVERINVQMAEAVVQHAGAYMSQDLPGLYALQDALGRSLALRNQMLLSEDRGSLRDMIDMKKNFQSELDKHLATVSIQTGGVLSCYTDGLEEQFTFAAAQSLTPEQTRMTAESASVGRGTDAQAGAPLFKIVESNQWRLAFYVPLGRLQDWQAGDTRTLYLQNSGAYAAVQMTVEALEPRGDQIFVLMHSTKGLLDFLTLRGVKLKTENSEQKGPKIPNGAIVERTVLKLPADFLQNEAKRLYVKRQGQGGAVEEVAVRKFSEKDEGDGSVYVFQNPAGLRLGDVLVANGAAFTVAEAENVKGVYLVNNGYAVFRQVLLNDAIPESLGYAILPPALNKNIRAYDEIVSDARNIEDGQQIYAY
jgi:hypothetical protein